jgi:hypothetical protein
MWIRLRCLPSIYRAQDLIPSLPKKRVCECCSVVECWPGMHQVLYLIPRTEKKERCYCVESVDFMHLAMDPLPPKKLGFGMVLSDTVFA